MAITRSVDQHIDRADRLQCLRYRRLDGRKVADIEHDRMRAALCQLLEVRAITVLAHGADHGMAGGQCGPGKRQAQAGTDAGDQPPMAHSVVLLVTFHYSDSFVYSKARKAVLFSNR